MLLLAAGCGQEKGPGDRTADLIREVTTAARTKTRIQMLVKSETEDPGPADLELRRQLEEKIEQRRIGRIVSTGGGAGFIEIVVEADNSSVAIPQLRDIAREAGVFEKASFRIRSDD